jgi:hypothetical protein
MPDWLDTLTPVERSEWDRFVDHFRRDTAEKIAGSAAFVSLVPLGETVDVKFAVELGAAIMLDKPILAVIRPGVQVPGKLAAVVDEFVEADLDIEEGQRHFAEAVKRFLDSRAENGQAQTEE